MSRIPFFGQRTQLSREEAIEQYILLRLRFEDIKRLGFLVENLHARAIHLPSGSPFTHADLKDTARTAFFGLFATLTDKDGKAVYAFDAANRLTQIMQGTTTVGFTFDNANRRATLTLPNGIVGSYTYDSASQLTGITYTNGTTTVGNLTYSYDSAARRTTVGGVWRRSICRTR